MALLYSIINDFYNSSISVYIVLNRIKLHAKDVYDGKRNDSVLIYTFKQFLMS